MKRLITGTWRWIDDRLGISDLIGPSMKHLMPRDATWWYVFGSATMLAFIVQVVTGVALAFSFVLSSSRTYDTLLLVTNAAPFVRSFARPALFRRVGDGADGRRTQAQTFLFGAYKYPREMNWTTGVLRLAFTLAMGLTDQLFSLGSNR